MGLLINALLATAFLGTGSLNTITNKILYQTKCTNRAGEQQYFDRPWFTTSVMFLGEFFCLIMYGIIAAFYRCIPPKVDNIDTNRELTPEEEEKLLERKRYSFISREEVERNPTGGLGWKYPLYIILFAFCDLGGTTLMSIGLTLCNASIIQIVRGFVIVFTMLLSWAILHRKPVAHQILGVCFSVLGLIIVGISAICSSSSGGSGLVDDDGGAIKTAFGIGLTLVGQVFSATQFTLEEKLLKQDNGDVAPIPPLFLVGSEGLAGCVLAYGIALPVVNIIPGNDFGSYENMKNSFYMLAHNPFIFGICFLSFASIAIFNWCGFVYSKALSAASRTVVDCLRTIIVWIVMITCYYTTHRYGEPVSKWSILQVCGFVFMVLGTITHNNVLGLGMKFTKPCHKNDEPEDKLDELSSHSTKVSSFNDDKELATAEKIDDPEENVQSPPPVL